MVHNTFEEFRELVLSDESLQNELRDLTNKNDFTTRLIELARERGYEITADEIDQEMLRSRRIWM